VTSRVLVVDDDVEMCRMLETRLQKRGLDTAWVTSGPAALTELTSAEYDVVVTDLNLGGLDGIGLCQKIVENHPDVPVVVLTAYGSLDTAIAAIRVGAYDFINKPVELDVLEIALNRAVAHRRTQDEVKRLRELVRSPTQYDRLLGASDAMKNVFQMIERVAATDASVLVTGESGTGKELAARALHANSQRADGPFVAVSCAALPEALLESELFGHSRGAFTDARAARTGLFVRAHRGTLLLDEIGDMPLGLQPKLLRVLQDKAVRPVGSDTEHPVDVRIISATHRDLESAVEDQQFREDLYYRLNVIRVHLPPLRDRGSDVLLLAQKFIERHAAASGKAVRGISAAAAERLLAHDWPGNVRELQNCMERAIALTEYDEIQVGDLPEELRRRARWDASAPAEDDPTQLVPLEEVERRHVVRVLKAVGGNKTAAAQILKVDRKTLYRKLDLYGLLKGDGPA
jgi:two-component system response regulator AtoC